MSTDEKKELSIEELIAIAKIPTQKKIRPYKQSDAYNFIVDMSLESGKVRVPARLIYDLYGKWKRKGKVQSKQLFFREFAKYMTRYTDGKTISYLMNIHPLDLEEAVEDKVHG